MSRGAVTPIAPDPADTAGRAPRRLDWHPELGDVMGAAGGGWKCVHYEHQFQDGEFEKEARAPGSTVVFHKRGDEGTAVLTV